MTTEYKLHLKVSPAPHTEHEKCSCKFDSEIEVFSSKELAVEYFKKLTKNGQWIGCFVQGAYIEEVSSLILEEYKF